MYLVSAIITTCKREPEMLERALKSVLAQTYKNLEIKEGCGCEKFKPKN